MVRHGDPRRSGFPASLAYAALGFIQFSTAEILYRMTLPRNKAASKLMFPVLRDVSKNWKVHHVNGMRLELTVLHGSAGRTQ
jgi:hypothetical protein